MVGKILAKMKRLLSIFPLHITIRLIQTSSGKIPIVITIGNEKTVKQVFNPFTTHNEGEEEDWEPDRPKVPSNRRYVWTNRARIVIHPNKNTLWDAYRYFYKESVVPDGVMIDLQAFWVILYEKIGNKTWESFNIHIRCARSLGSWDTFYEALGHEMTHYLELMEESTENTTRKERPLYGDQNMYAMREE